MTQIPRAAKGRACPFHNKDMSLVCHKCPLWFHVRGTNPQTGKETDMWDCSLAWLPTLVIEGAQMTRHATASVDALRREIDVGNRNNVAALADLTNTARRLS